MFTIGAEHLHHTGVPFSIQDIHIACGLINSYPLWKTKLSFAFTRTTLCANILICVDAIFKPIANLIRTTRHHTPTPRTEKITPRTKPGNTGIKTITYINFTTFFIDCDTKSGFAQFAFTTAVCREHTHAFIARLGRLYTEQQSKKRDSTYH